MQQRVRKELQDRYGTEDKDEIRKLARAEMVQRMEDQLAKEGVDVRGVSNVMEEMSRRNRELFQLPTWVLYVVRAFSTLEGIGLSVDESYAILKESYSVWKSTSELGFLPQLFGQCRVDGVGRPKFDFHTGATRTSPADYSRTIRLERGPPCRR